MKCILWENAIQSHWFFSALLRSDRLKIVLALAYRSKKPFFFFLLDIYFSAILDGIKNVFSSSPPSLCWIFCIPAYFSFRSTSVKSNPLEPCNAVTLLDFLFLLEEDYEAPWLANKSWQPESLKNKFTLSADVICSPFSLASLFFFTIWFQFCWYILCISLVKISSSASMPLINYALRHKCKSILYITIMN